MTRWRVLLKLAWLNLCFRWKQWREPEQPDRQARLRRVWAQPVERKGRMA